MPGQRVGTPIKNERLVSERRARIVAAARAVFRAKGFHSATVRDVGEAAGLTQGTLYNYVRSKDDILFLVCAEMTGAYIRDVRAAIAGVRDPQRRLAVAVRALTEAMDRRQEDVLLLYHESHALNREKLHLILADVSAFISLFEELFAEARAAGLALAHAPEADAIVADIVTFLPTILALRRWRLRRVASHTRVLRALTDFTLGGLGIAAAGEVARAAQARRPRLLPVSPARAAAAAKAATAAARAPAKAAAAAAPRGPRKRGAGRAP